MRWSELREHAYRRRLGEAGHECHVYEPHRQGYDQTAIAKVMKEGLADFFDHLLDRIGTLAGGGMDEEAKANKAILDGFYGYLSRHGFAMTVEVAPPQMEKRPRIEDIFQLTIVFPKGGMDKNRQPIEKLLHSGIFTESL